MDTPTNRQTDGRTDRDGDLKSRVHATKKNANKVGMFRPKKRPKASDLEANFFHILFSFGCYFLSVN